VVTKRSGVTRPQALELARTASSALTDRGVPNPIAPEDASSCNAKLPCLMNMAQKKGVSVLVTLEAGSAPDDVVLHRDALGVEEFGKKLPLFDSTGPAKGFDADVKAKIEEAFAPAVRGVLGTPSPAPEGATPPVPQKPEPPPVAAVEPAPQP